MHSLAEIQAQIDALQEQANLIKNAKKMGLSQNCGKKLKPMI
jgi:hypothetical protein